VVLPVTTNLSPLLRRSNLQKFQAAYDPKQKKSSGG